MVDRRNVIDEFKGVDILEIVQQLDERGVCLEIAIENVTRDYNMGTIVRSANAFGVRTVHVVGSRQWNKRGAMMTDKYLHVVYHASVADLAEYAEQHDFALVAVDNVAGSQPLAETTMPKNALLVFGAEGPGLSDELLMRAAQIVAIEQLGSTRSINVGVAAGIVMYEWLRVHAL